MVGQSRVPAAVRGADARHGRSSTSTRSQNLCLSIISCCFMSFCWSILVCKNVFNYIVCRKVRCVLQVYQLLVQVAMARPTPASNGVKHVEKQQSSFLSFLGIGNNFSFSLTQLYSMRMYRSSTCRSRGNSA